MHIEEHGFSLMAKDHRQGESVCEANYSLFGKIIFFSLPPQQQPMSMQ
jgi:hypothetical protein